MSIPALFLAAAAWAQTSIRVRLLQSETLVDRLRGLPSENALRQQRLIDLFRDAGCIGDRLQIQPVKGRKLGNVVCTLPGQTDNVVIVGAHFDKVNAGQGTMDNGSGMLLLPALYLALSGEARNQTFVFAGFTDEEAGLLGSRFFAKSIPKGERGRYRAMVNMDTLGLGPVSVWRSHSNRDLQVWFVAIAEALQFQDLHFVDVEKVGDADSSSFKEIGIPVIDFHSITQKTFPILHSKDDNLTALRTADYTEAYRLIAHYLAYLDGKFRDQAEDLKPTKE